MIFENIKIVAFDADDTLWVNEPYYRETEKKYCELLAGCLPKEVLEKELLDTEIQNVHLYGFGAKSFMLSMIETALRISNGQLHTDVFNKILALGKELIQYPIELLEDVKPVLEQLAGRHTLVVATKGDLLDQHRKLKNSGLSEYFHHVEVMSDKKENDYWRLISHLNIKPGEFAMIGNSLKSDIIPVLQIGGYGFHVPYHTMWEFERTDEKVDSNRFCQLESLKDIVKYI